MSIEAGMARDPAAIRVLQAMAGAEHGGAEQFFTRLVPALHQAGVEQRAVIRTHARRAATLRDGGVVTVELPFGGPLDVRTRWQLRRQIRRFRPHIVMTWMNRASKLCPPGPFVRIGRLGGYYDLKYYRRCDHLVVATDDIGRHVVEAGFDASRVHRIANFADAAPAQPTPRSALATPDDVGLVVATGRLHRNKAYDVLIRAMSRVPGAYLWLAGLGPEQHALAALAAELGLSGRIRFLGWRDDVPSLLRAADVYVCPSRHEPFGSILVEAWAHSVPLIAAASQGPRSVITDNEDGLLVPIDDAEALAVAIRAVLADPKMGARLARAGHAAYGARYAKKVIVAAYRDLFARILESA